MFEHLLFVFTFLSCVTTAVKEKRASELSWAALNCFHCSMSHIYVSIPLQLTLPIISLEFQKRILNYTKENILFLHFSLLQRKKQKQKKTQTSIHFVLLMLVNNMASYTVTWDRNLEIILEYFFSFTSPSRSLLRG